jgi:2-keto-4-pentenoate hydratase
MSLPRAFASDNTAPVHPAVFDWLQRVNAAHAAPYGEDHYSVQVREWFRKQFGEGTESHLVWNGTGANVVGLRAMTRPWQAVLCAEQAHINVDGPLAGRLLRERVVDEGGEVPFGRNRMRVAELEFAFRMGKDLTPRAAPYSTNEALDAVATLHPAIEIPDSRYADFTITGAPQLIADNACAHYFVLGPATSADWRSIDLRQHQPVGTVRHADGSRVERQGLGANVLGDPRDALAWLVNELSSLGITLGAGQVVTTGTCLVPLPIQAGDHVEGDFGILGRVTARIR